MFRSILSLLVVGGLACALLLSAPFSALAGDKEAKDGRELPSMGSLSGSFIGGNEGVAVEGTWGRQDTDIFSEDKSPITGSVSRSQRDKREWTVKVFNNSEDDFSLTAEVLEYDKNRKQIARVNHSFMLRAGQSREKAHRARVNTEQAELRLVHWKNLSARKRKKEQAAEEAKKADDGK